MLQCVLFDLDGTLVNSAPDVRLALNHTLSHYGQCALETNEIYTFLGSGPRVLIERAFQKYDVSLNAAEMQEAIQCYLNFYKANPVVDTYIYPGVLTVLNQLAEANIKLGVCTNKPGVMSRLVLNKLKIDHLFAGILSGDEVPNPKPHGDHIHTLLRNMQMPNAKAVMVGDSEIDQASAKHAGVPFVGVSYGYDSGSLNHPIVINDFHDLPKALTTITSKGLLS